MKYVYMVLWETEMYGAWTNPRDAVRWLLGDDEEDIHGLPSDSPEDLDRIVEKMLKSDYPALVKIPVNPTGEPWYMDR